MTTPPPSPPPAPSAPHTSFSFKAAVLAIPLVILLAIVGVSFRTRVRKAAQLEKQLQGEKQREKNLAGVASQNAEYLRLIRDLERRLETIDYLQNSYTSPVEVLRAVGKLATQTADVDFTSLSDENGRWVLRGRARSVKSAAALLASLPSQGFSHVQLREFYQEGGHIPTTYGFEFDCVYSPP